MDKISTYRWRRSRSVCAVVIACLWVGVLPAQNVGPHTQSLGGVSTVLVDPWAAGNNPALLAGEAPTSLAVDAYNRFFIPELTEASFLAQTELYKGNIGLHYRHYGFSSFQEHRLRVAYGLMLSQSFWMGTAFTYDRLMQMEGYPSQGSVSVDVGMLFTLADDWRIGAQVHNPTRSRWPNALNELRSMRMEIGVEKCFNASLAAYAELEKEMDQALLFGCGIAYQVRAPLTIRTGIRTADRSWRLGLSYEKNGRSINITQVWSQALGLSSSLGLALRFMRAKGKVG